MFSPKKYTANLDNNSRVKSAELTEIEIGNTTFNFTTSDIPQLQTENSSTETEHAIDGTRKEFQTINMDSPPTSTESYIQVVVQKQPKRNSEPHAKNNRQPTPRLPKASSPIKLQKIVDPNTGNGMYVMPPSFFLLPQQPYTWNIGHNFVETATSARSSNSFKKMVKAVRCENKQTAKPNKEINKEPNNTDDNGNTDFKCQRKWTLFDDDNNDSHNNPNRIEVYYFDRGCAEYLSTTDCSPVPITERVVSRGTYIVDRILSEVCAVPHLFIAVPIKLIVQVQKLILISVRNMITESTQTYSDYFLKPVLTVLFNAIIQPPLIFASNIGIGVRNILKPLWDILGDMVDPVVKLVGSFHLVYIQKKCRACEQSV